MPSSLFYFTNINQNAALTSPKSFAENTTDKFRVTSSFTIASPIPAYAMLSGTILLQQQANNPGKVNLIIKPNDLKNIKLPIKYIVYRGLDTLDFIEKTDLSDTTNQVKTTGTELLAEMQVIQQSRAAGQAIPIQALFGSDLTPANTQRIDDFYFANQGASANTQLYAVNAGTELGNFAVGEIGLEIILESPDFFLTVKSAKKSFDEIDVSDIIAGFLVKAAKEKIRHYIDPAAFYGLHYDISGGIGYKEGATGKVADTPALVYDKILQPFATKNTVYLDIRNENGYSYNYDDNYVGNTGTTIDDNKELKIGPTAASLTLTEYYTNGWPIHQVSISPSSTAPENEFSLALRINDNERPLLAGRNIALHPNSVIDPPMANLSSRRVYFTDEIHLLPTPIPDTLPEFTNAITIKVPNIPGTPGKQIATLARLDYIKQSLPVSSSNQSPKLNFTDYIFGPLNTKLPFTTNDNQIVWHTTNHQTYIGTASDGFILGQYKTTILAIDTNTNEIEIFDEVPLELSKEVIIEYVSGRQQSYSPISYVAANGKTKISVPGPIDALQTGDQLTLTIRLDGSLDPSAKKFVIRDKNVTNLEILHPSNRLDLYALNSFLTSLEVDSAQYNGTNTEVIFSGIRSKIGYGGFVETGILIEDDTLAGGVDNDRVLFYATPVVGTYIDKADRKKRKFNKGGKFRDKSFEDALKLLLPEVDFDKTVLDFTPNLPVNTFAYTKNHKATEFLFLLGITKKEWEAAKMAATGQITTSPPFFRLLSTSGVKLDQDSNIYYEYDLQITGRDNEGNYQVIDLGKKIYSTDKMVYVSQEFGKKFDLDSTLQMQVLDDFIYETLYQNGKNFQTAYNAAGKPNFYFSYEEEINLSSGKYWLYYPGGVENKELFRLDVMSPPIATTFTDKVVAFKDALDNIPSRKRHIQELLQKRGADLLEFAKAQIRITGKPWTNKDGMLYLARLIMSVIIRNHPKLNQYSSNKIQQFIDEFERHSRGLEGSEKPSFPNVLGNPDKINILISGFDPFAAAFNSYYDWQGHQSNSTGNIALSLDGITISQDPSFGNKEALIKSVIIPVRFREFDEGWIDDFFEPYVRDNNINIIITFSYQVDGIIYSFEIERFAAKNRADDHDNNHLINPRPKYFKVDSSADPHKKEFLLSTLPFTFPWNNTTKDKNMIIPNEVGLDQAFELAYYDKTILQQPLSVPNPSINLANPSITPALVPDPNIYALVPRASNGYLPNGVTANRIQAVKGPGGHYLSNEIFYRVAYLRDKYFPLKWTGHLHVGYLKGDTYEDRKRMFYYIEQFVKNILNGL